MDKMTNGFIKIGTSTVAEIKGDLKKKYKELCKKEFGVDAKVTVKIHHVSTLPDYVDYLDFTHAYQVRCRA